MAVQAGGPGSDPTAQELGEWFTTLYRELRTLASTYLRQESRGLTLQTTALIHEAFLRLADQHTMGWHDRRGFFAAAATTMRRVLVDHARARKAKKRSGKKSHEPLDEVVIAFEENVYDLVRLDDALNALHTLDPRMSQVVELRFFAGLSVEQVAELLDISPRSVAREWSLARAWLLAELSGEGPSGTD